MKKSSQSKTQSTLFQTWGCSDKQKKSDERRKEVTNSFPIHHQKFLAENLIEDLDKSEKDDIELMQCVSAFEKDTSCYDGNSTKSYENLNGFDETFGSSYIYPTNYPVRDYQFNIIKKAFYENTLVVLPTGLGKTFIAAVVMYNFYRWYPAGKLIFMAPTKPLVAQQIEACYKIMGLPQEDTVEMTGAIPPNKRQVLWQEKRVFFLTPQVLQNDLGRGSCFAPDVICLVFDEAHKALGNHAYCQVVKEIANHRSNFRILALSATPGDDMKAVQQVINNLLIARIEVRTEESIDIQKYVHKRKIEKIVVPMSDDLKNTKTTYVELLRDVLNRLYARKAIWQNDPEKISKFMLLKGREQWRANNAMENRSKNGSIEGDFALCISLCHAFELLQQHGIMSFYNFLKSILAGTKGTSRSKMELSRNSTFMNMMEDLHSKIEPNEGNQSLNETIMADRHMTPKTRLLKSIPKPLDSFSSHPKLRTLEEIVVKHFRQAKHSLPTASQTPLNTRVMIFSQYRDSVQEITAVLSKYEPLVKVMSFIGQGSKEGVTGKNTKGLSQKEQLEVLHRFRSGGYNTVVSTSVGEEGLDIGDVDLIVCFDASSSPIRLVQRMGRTGRKRDGRIVILVGEGKEEQIYKRSLNNKKGIHKNLLNAANSFDLYAENPRMIPKHLNPVCFKMVICVDEYKPRNHKKETRNITGTCKERTAASKDENRHTSSTTELNDNLKEKKNSNENLEGCEKCKKLQSKKPCKHRKYSSTLQSKPRTTNQNFDAGKTWRMNYQKMLQDGRKSSEDEDFDGMLPKLDVKNSDLDGLKQTNNLLPKFIDKLVQLTDEDAKPCSIEKSLQDVEKSIKLKRRVRRTKLPATKIKTELNISGVQDNQLEFCSQITMPTLFNRCQQERKNLQSQLSIQDAGEANIETNNSDENVQPGFVDLPVFHTRDEEEVLSRTRLDSHSDIAKKSLNDFNNVPEETDKSKSSQMSILLPLSTQRSKVQTSKSVCVVAPFVHETIPEPPAEIDLSSFILNDSILNNKSLQKTDKEHSREDDDIEKFFGSVGKKMEELICKTKSTSSSDVKREQHSHDQNDDYCQDFLFTDDSLLNLMSDNMEDEEDNIAESPPMVSQINLKTITVQSENLNIKATNKAIGSENIKTAEDDSYNNVDTKKSLSENTKNKEIDCNSKHESFAGGDMKSKSIVDQNHFQDKDSPLFCKLPRSRLSRKKRILDSQSPSCNVNDTENVSSQNNHASKRKHNTYTKDGERSIERDTSRKKRKANTRCNSFIDDEADVDEEEESDYENDSSSVNGYVMDSFIDDSTQDTPSPPKKRPNDKEHGDVNMTLIYKKSLMSPHCGMLNFRSPALKKNRNRYKLANLAEKYNNRLSDESSEAEEVNHIIESEIESEVGEYVRSTPKRAIISSKSEESDEETFEENRPIQRKIRRLPNRNKLRLKSVSDEEPSLLDENKACARVQHIIDSDDDFQEVMNQEETNITKSPELALNLSKAKSPELSSTLETVESRSWCKTFSLDELTETNFSFNISWDEGEILTEESDVIINNAPKRVASWETVRPTVIVIDSKCVANSQICSMLRSKGDCHVVICQQLKCDFIVSQRTALLKRTISDISNSGNSQKLIESVRTMSDLYVKSCIIIEKDRMKKNASNKSKNQKSCLTKYYANVLVQLASTDVTVLYSSSQEDSARLIKELADRERNAGFAIFHPLNTQPDHMTKALLCAPKMTYPVVAELVKHHKTLDSLLQCSLDEWKKTLSFLSPKRIGEIFFFFKRKFDISMYGSKKIL